MRSLSTLCMLGKPAVDLRSCTRAIHMRTSTVARTSPWNWIGSPIRFLIFQGDGCCAQPTVLTTNPTRVHAQEGLAAEGWSKYRWTCETVWFGGMPTICCSPFESCVISFGRQAQCLLRTRTLCNDR